MRSHSEGSSPTPLSLLLPPLGVMALLWVTRAYPVTPQAGLYAFLMFLVPWSSFLVWRQQNRGGLPIFALVGFAYWWYFAIGLFWLDRTIFSRGYSVVEVNDVDGAMRLALVGVACVGLGMNVQLSFLRPSRQLELNDHATSWLYVRLILVAGTVGSLAANNSTKLLGPQGRNVMEILISTVPMTAMLLLLRKCLTDRGAKLDKLLLSIYFPVMVVGGIASGWVGASVTLGLVFGAMYVLVHGKVPWKVMAVSAAAVLFLQVGKKEFRQLYWDAGADGGIVERAAFWANGSTVKWSEAMNSGSVGSARELVVQSLARTSLLTQVAHVLDLTPSDIPFQRGQTYSYLTITFIPRFLWTDKPSVNEANQYYQVAFGLTDVRDLDKVSIAVGCLAEAYINFGWPGVIGIMFGVGVVLGIYERSFVGRDSSILFLAIGVALLRGVLAVEAQMAQYVGGVVQQVMLTLLVFLPVVHRRDERVVVEPTITPAMGRLRVQPQQ
jgi:hypothetical protein